MYYALTGYRGKQSDLLPLDEAQFDEAQFGLCLDSNWYGRFSLLINDLTASVGEFDR